MGFQQHNIAKFNQGIRVENARFWTRMGDKPDFKGASILEIGSGWGSMCVDMALEGAARVVGLDLKPDLVAFSNAYTQQNYPQLSDVVEFKNAHLQYYDASQFDCIISKDTFEHIVDFDFMLNEMKKRLKPGGRIYTGFGPLYTSPYGDHNRRKVILKPLGVWGRLLVSIPWGHLFMEPMLVKLNNRYRDKKISSMRDLQLSKMAASDYKKAFQKSGFTIINFRINQSERLTSKIFAELSKIAFLEDYFTHSIYCILEKEESPHP